MVNRLAAVAACMLIPIAVAPSALADPPGDPAPAVPLAGEAPPPPDTGAVASEVPGIANSPDGWNLKVFGKDETQLAVPPLTTALSSREYLVGGTFTGEVTGKGKTTLSGGTLEVGYQIGCGISLNVVKLNGSVGLGIPTTALGAVPTGLTFPIQGQIEVHPQPGEVTNVSVTKKSFKAAPVRVTVKDIHVKVDGCVGQSFLRSYAVLTSSSTDNDDVVAYYGVAKVV
ncbi:MspA family porin [Mycobacterium sp. MYCO198283]|uniref:MspA family porin n=1 Tax=Mycobacterium sp. MYCO198283 TaxID=2883505 RepID=UPI001E3356C2|nr:MspA family porin [Mycobacterium sp. MYCO198283]MCG5432435.1 MspA family porin [Mycobacterium sp. MYCO198283]